MRIEILIGNSDEPLIYPLNNPKLIIGSAETCDIIINATNVSRKHLLIISENDSFYVVDQGSTNGTYINEERLVPGRRAEFTSFFPVRLGDSVLITLLSDEEISIENKEAPEVSLNTKSSIRSPEDSTKVLSLRDLQKAKTADLVGRRKKVVKKRATNSEAGGASKTKLKSAAALKREQDKKRMNVIKFMVLLIFGGAAYVNFFMIEKPAEVEVAKIGEVLKEAPKPEAQKPALKIVPTAELPDEQRVENLITDIKCTLDIEKYLCGTIANAKGGPYGAIQVGTMVYVLVDGSSFIDEARRILKMPASVSATGEHSPEEIAEYEKNIKWLAGAIFLLRSVPNTIDYEMLKDYRLTFGLFFKNSQGQDELHEAVVALPSSIKEFKRIFEEVHLQNVTRIGPSAIEFTKELFTVIEKPKESSETQPAPSSLPE